MKNISMYKELNGEIYLGNSKELMVLSKKFELLRRKDSKPFYMRQIHNSIFVETKNDVSEENIVNMSEGCKFVLKGFLTHCLIDDEFVYILDVKRSLVKFNYNLTEKIDEFLVGRFPLFIKGNIYIRILSSVLEARYLTTNEIIWSYQFTDLLEGKEIEQVGELLIYDSLLIICLRDNCDPSNQATFVLDVNSGEIKKTYEGFSGQLIREGDYLYVAAQYTVQRVDLKSQELTIYNVEDILKPVDLLIHWNSSFIAEGMLYFVDGLWARTHRMGILDLSLRKLAWQYDFTIEDDLNKNIVKTEITEGYLYVHCSDRTLYIFEKE